MTESLSYRNQSIAMDWFLYDRDLRHERVKLKFWKYWLIKYWLIITVFTISSESDHSLPVTKVPTFV